MGQKGRGTREVAEQLLLVRRTTRQIVQAKAKGQLFRVEMLEARLQHRASELANVFARWLNHPCDDPNASDELTKGAAVQ